MLFFRNQSALTRHRRDQRHRASEPREKNRTRPPVIIANRGRTAPSEVAMKYRLPNLDPALDSAAFKLALATGGVGTVIRLLNSALEVIPDGDFEAARQQDAEAGSTKPCFSAFLYHSCIFSFLFGASDAVGIEAHTVGSSGLLVKAAAMIWIIELEVYRDRDGDGQAEAEEALGRILAHRGAFHHQGHRVLLGIAIDDYSRAITSWKAQSLMPGSYPKYHAKP